MLEFIKLSVNDYHSIVSTNEGLLRVKLLPNSLGVSKACYCVSMLGRFSVVIIWLLSFSRDIYKTIFPPYFNEGEIFPPGKENQAKG